MKTLRTITANVKGTIAKHRGVIEFLSKRGMSVAVVQWMGEELLCGHELVTYGIVWKR